jgi:radical SAM superfamily enzyme YgiQ (UPF0313 family)
MPNALLVYPEFPLDSYWNFRLAHEQLFPRNRFGYAKGVMPPLGLLSIAGPISERYGRQNVRLIDMNIQPLTDQDLSWADDVYLSAMLTQSASFDHVAARAKAMGKRTIGGGPYVDENTPNLDYVFIDECEHTLVPFLEQLLGDALPVRVQRGRRPGGDAFFSPDYSFIDVNHYISMGLQYSRGCPHDCEFCDITARYGRAMRVKACDAFLKELDRLYELGWRGSVFIIDDNFIGKPKAALQLLEALAVWQREHRYPFEMYTQATVLLAEERNKDLLQALYPAGFSMVFLGIETPNEKSLQETKKHHNLRPGLSLAQKIKKIQRVGKVLVLGGFIVGFDSDTKDIFAQQQRFIVDEIRIPTPMVGILEPLPQTKLDQRLDQEGRRLDNSNGSIASGADVSFIPQNISEQELKDGYLGLLRSIYLDADCFYSRCYDAIGYVGKPLFQGIYNRDMLVAIVRLLVAEGVTAKSRWSFWRFLAKTLRHHPQKVPYALRWAGYGLHYRILTEKILHQ